MHDHPPPTQYPGKEYYFGKPLSKFYCMVPSDITSALVHAAVRQIVKDIYAEVL